jgi:hypothetical protein
MPPTCQLAEYLMSFYMEVELDRAARERAGDLAEICSLAGGLPIIKPRRVLLGKARPKKLIILDVFGGESVLADDADWNAPTWSMRPEALPALEATLRCLCRHIPEGFAFVAAWVSDRISRELQVSCDELIDLVRQSGLNGKTRYRVTARAYREA